MKSTPLILGALALALAAGPALALRNPALTQQRDLPRDQFLDLVDPAKVRLDQVAVKFNEDLQVRLREGKLVELGARSLDPVLDFLGRHPELSLTRLFDTLEEKALDDWTALGEQRSGVDLADLNNWYMLTVAGPNDKARMLLEDILALDAVQTCYYEPIPRPAVCGSDPSPATPSYLASQDYREAAPTGVDIQYAWDHNPTYGNGISSYWFQDLEWGWCEGHEDFAALSIRNTPDSTDPAFYNHGSSVMSIVGACSDSKGVTGLVPEVYLTARVVSNHTSTAAALTAIGTDLVLGETYLIEMHAGGPDPGWTCVCNCDQFTYIAMEYWTANYDAILANSANGRFCVEAAGNGSMDLDWSGYGGAFNLSVRDSQAIMVGAGTSGATHNPECWTNHGSRISAMGWGDSVYAAGYGDLFNQTSCEQDYTSSFSGTSSASPIVTGAAISLALIHYNQEGSYPSPTTLRSRLQTNGTPQGPVDTWKEISVLPNMKGILAPDLAPFQPAGWDDEVVASNVSGTHTISTDLAPAPAATWLDWSWVNWSHYASATNSRGRLYVDDVHRVTASTASHAPYTYAQYSDHETTVRGGLHVLRLECDPLGEVDESVESNNTFVRDYRWDPTPLLVNAPASYSRGPKRNPTGYAYTALDGFSNGGNYSGYWEAFAVMPETGADYDMRLYTTEPTATTGWTLSAASSGYVSETDFVGSNNNAVQDGDYPGVINYSDSAEGYTVEGDASVYMGSPPAVQTAVGSYSLDTGEILDVFEFYVSTLAPIHFAFDVAGSADLAAFVYAPSTTYFTRTGASLTINSGGAGADEAAVFTPSTTGYHGLVVCKNLCTELDLSATYALSWGPPTGDITTVARSGWTAPVVARNSGGSVGVLPAILNEGASLADAGVANVGLGTVPAGANLAFYVDGPFVTSSGNFIAMAPGYEGEISGRSIGSVKGGRHELGAVQDYLGEIAEELPAGELNNTHYAQYVWAPHALTGNVPEERSAAPNWSNFDNPGHWSQAGYNQDGYLFTTQYWTGLAAIPSDAAMQLNVQGYNYASTHPVSALLAPVSFDYDNTGRISLVMSNGNVLGNAVPLNAGVHNNWAWPYVTPVGSYTVQSAPWHGDLSLGVPHSGSLEALAGTGGELVHSHDIFLTAGQTQHLRLFNTSGVDLGVAVFSAGQDFVPKNAALAEFNSVGAGVDEEGDITAWVTGWHGVAVYRSGTGDLGPAASYTLVVGPWSPAQPLITTITPVDFSPGNATVHIEITPITTDIYGNPLVIDYYTLYYDDNGYMDSPGVESTTSTSLNLYFGNVGMLERGFVRVTAVDTNGTLVADSQPGLPLPAAGSVKISSVSLLAPPEVGPGK